MKYESTIVKCLFFTIIIGLIIIAIYVLYIDNYKSTEGTEEYIKEEVYKNSISIGIINFDTLNPLLTKNKDLQYILQLVYEPLIKISVDFDLESGLAKEWSKIDETTYLIKLDEDKFWQDGTKFTSRDVEFTITTLQNQWLNSIYYENVENIDEVIIIDEYTLKIVLNESTDFYEYKLVFPIIAKHQYDETLNEVSSMPVGTGGYSFSEIRNTSFSLKNDNAKTPILNVLIYDKINTIYSEFAKQKIDIMLTGNVNFDKYVGKMGYKTKIIPDRKMDYILINENNEFLKNKNIREVINLIINRKDINYAVYNNKYVENTAFISSEQYNPIKAKDILISDGWTYKNDGWYKNNKKLVLNLSVNYEQENRVKVAEMIKEEAESIGIKINIIKVDSSNYKYALKNRYYDLILTGIIMPLEPNYSTLFVEPNETITLLLKEIKNIDNIDVRKEKIEELKNEYQLNIPFISLYTNSNILLLNSNLKGDFNCNWFSIFGNIENWYANSN
ncbi:MAG: ABC transporter substrate-binding protein [Clostridia bacterium]